jgi:4-hydroxy-2-oxoheptanedioate aldolase
VGPNDLAVTHGLAPSANVESPEHAELIGAILAGCQRHRVVAGIHCGSVETAQRWRQAGFLMLNVNSDAVFMRQHAAAVVKALTGEPAEGPRTSSYA